MLSSKFLSLPIVGAASLALMVGLAACGGSGRTHVAIPPTLEETVRAINEAMTPAQGQFAYSQTIGYVGLRDGMFYANLPEETRRSIQEAAGALIAGTNLNTIDLTLEEVIETANEVSETSIDPATVVEQLNAALANPAGSPAEKDLKLILAVEGAPLSLTDEVNGAMVTPIVRWFTYTYYDVDANALVRSNCTNGCDATYDPLKLRVHADSNAAEANVLAAYKENAISLALSNVLKSVITASKNNALASIERLRANCYKGCHGQS